MMESFSWGWRWLEQFAQDVRFGVRMLVKSPAVTVVAIATLALATGATTAIFSVLNGVVLRPLPFAEPERLVQVYGRDWAEDRGATPDPVRGPVHPRDLEAFVRTSKSFDGFSAYAVTTLHVETASGTERLNAVSADANLFSVLGVQAVLGRTFGPDDPENVAVVSRRLWRERFAGDPSLPGRTLTLNGQVFTVLGVMPEPFQFPYRAASLLPGTFSESRTDLWVPGLPLRSAVTGEIRRGRSAVVARLAPGVALATALAELRVIGAGVEAQEKDPPRRVGVRLEPLHDVVSGPVRRSLWMLFGVVGLVLAAACLNLANLMLARLTVRSREVLTRAALGATRTRVMRQFLSESLLLALAGGLAGIAVARWGSDLLVRLAATLIPRSHEIRLDWQAFAFLLLASVVAAVAFGIAPAVLASRLDVSGLSREAGGSATAGRRFARLRDGLVVAEVTLAFVLAVGACLMVREMIRLRRVDTGMATANVLVLHLSPRVPVAEYYAIEERVSHLPGVAGAGFIQLVPMQNWGWQAGFSIDGRPPNPGERRVTELRYVTPGYFRAAGIPLRRGRFFTASDVEGAPAVVLVNEAFARRYFPNEDPVGRKLDRGLIAGVVGDVPTAGLDRPVRARAVLPGGAERGDDLGSGTLPPGPHTGIAREPDTVDSRRGGRRQPESGHLQRAHDDAGGRRLDVGSEPVSMVGRAVRAARAGARDDWPLRGHRLHGVGAVAGVCDPACARFRARRARSTGPAAGSVADAHGPGRRRLRQLDCRLGLAQPADPERPRPRDLRDRVRASARRRPGRVCRAGVAVVVG